MSEENPLLSPEEREELKRRVASFNELMSRPVVRPATKAKTPATSSPISAPEKPMGW